MTTRPTPGPHIVGPQGTQIEDCITTPDTYVLGMAFYDGDPDEAPAEEAGKRWITKEEAEANARLWSAAGELLEAAQAQIAIEERVAALTDRVTRQGDWSRLSPDDYEEQGAITAELRRVKALRAAAVAKATGEEIAS